MFMYCYVYPCLNFFDEALGSTLACLMDAKLKVGFVDSLVEA